MNEKRRLTLGEVVAGLMKIVLPIAIFVVFINHSGKLAEFDDRRAGVYRWMNSVYEDSRQQAYKIVKHLRVEYVIIALAKDGRELLEGEIPQIKFNEQEGLAHPYSRETHFIYQMLEIIVDNEASLFCAQFKRKPSVDEMYAILEDIPYWGYLQALQDSLYELEWRQNKASHPNNFTGWDIEELEQFSKAFEPQVERVKTLLSQNPSKLNFIQIHFANPSQDI